MTPTLEDIHSVLVDIAPELAGTTVDPKADLVSELDLDSMDFLNFLVALSKRYQVKIEESEYSRFSSLGACLEILREKQSSAGPQS